jgi:hypothetical protein
MGLSKPVMGLLYLLLSISISDLLIIKPIISTVTVVQYDQNARHWVERNED